MIETQEYTEFRYALDGNSAAGMLRQVFSTEMTAFPAECAHCGSVNPIGATLAYGRDMGTVLRCPDCDGVLVRIAERPDGIWLDMQGVSLLRLAALGV